LEEGAFDAATPVLEHDEGLALAALAHRADLSGDDRRDLLAPAAATAFASAVAALARVAAGFPEGIELAEVGSDEGLEFAAMRIERMPAQVMAQGVAFAGKLLRQRPFGDHREGDLGRGGLGLGEA